MSLLQSDTLHAQPQATCFVCGSDNPGGLQFRYECGVDGTVNATWTPTGMCEGFRGIVHGGIVSTVLDEAMSKAVFATNCQALTCELRVRFRHHVTVGEALRIRGWVVSRQNARLQRKRACALSMAKSVRRPGQHFGTGRKPGRSGRSQAGIASSE